MEIRIVGRFTTTEDVISTSNDSNGNKHHVQTKKWREMSNYIRTNRMNRKIGEFRG